MWKVVTYLIARCQFTSSYFTENLNSNWREIMGVVVSNIWKSSLLCFPFLMDECEPVPGGQSRPFPTRFCDKNFHKIDLGAKSNFREKSGRHYHNQDYGPNGRQNIYAWSLVFFAPLPKSLTNKCFWILPTGRKDWAHLIIELNHCVLRDRRSRWGNEKDSWHGCEQKYHRFTFLNFSLFFFGP